MADIADGVTCARAGCGHLSDQHADLDTGGNSGQCSECDCAAMVVPGDNGQPAPAEAHAAATDTPEGAPPADGDDDESDAPGIPFRALLVQEGVDTSDGRHIAPEALTWREPPLPLMVQFRADHGGIGDTSSEIAGRIDAITREPGAQAGTFDIIGTGVLDAEGEHGLECARLIAGSFLRGVSADIAVSEAEIEITEVDDDGFPIGERLIVTGGELGMATVTPFPAFGDCQIEITEDPGLVPPSPDEIEMPEVGDRIPILASFTYTLAEGCVPCEQRAQVPVTAAGGPLAPPAAWFTDPGLDGPTPLTVDDDGRVFGHLAAWGTCHVGTSSSCVTAPRESDYSYFETGSLLTAEGDEIPVGQLTLAGGHADLRLGYRAAMQHYDDTDSAVADVRMGPDSHGIWFAGALRPGVTDEQLRAFRAAPLSGDWRPIGGALRLVAACSVNVPGFPLPRARVASGHTVALVAAGVVAPKPEPVTASSLSPEDLAELRAWRLERQAERALREIDRALT